MVNFICTFVSLVGDHSVRIVLYDRKGRSEPYYVNITKEKV